MNDRYDTELIKKIVTGKSGIILCRFDLKRAQDGKCTAKCIRGWSQNWREMGGMEAIGD